MKKELDIEIINRCKKFETKYQKVLKLIQKYDRIAVFRHVKPDYDALGCQLAMAYWIKDNFKENKTIFIVNHAEMSDDYFDHKIRVRLENKKIMEKKEQIVVYSSNYEKIF